MIKVAITGNIASGKSQTESILQKMGYKVFDADKIAHTILESSNEVIKTFKDFDITINGKISREKLGAIVFTDPNLKKELENIIHPKVEQEINRLFEEYNTEKYIFISIPLLFEAGMETMFDKILFVYCDDDTRLQRLISRNNLSKESALLRIRSQQPQADKVKKCDYVVKNESTITDLETQIKNLF